jgi:hypothetical protein
MDWAQHHEQLITEATQCLFRVQNELRAVVIEPEEDEGGGEGAQHSSDNEMLHMLQLMLQFRLDTQDALRRLFQYSQGLWQILGLSPKNAVNTNMERLIFALGSEDLHHALSMLNQLIEALLRVLQRLQLNQSAQRKSALSRNRALMQRAPTTSKSYQHLVHVVDSQKSFIFILNQLTNSLVTLEAEPAIGPVLDYISRLEGPVSHFHQALLNGLELSAGLYQQMEATCQLNKKLDELILQANLVLERAYQHTEQPRLFHPTKALSSSESLEARAAEKRLRPFLRPWPANGEGH